MAVRFPGIYLKNGLEDALLLSVKLSSEERAKFGIFLLHLSGLIVCFRMEQLGFLYFGNYTESLSHRGAITPNCPIHCLGRLHVSAFAGKSHLIVTPCIRPAKKSLLQ